MEARTWQQPYSSTIRYPERLSVDQRKRQHKRRNCQSFFIDAANGNKKSKIKSSYYSMESTVILVCLTASLLILPLILPPLPPPPFLLLLVPLALLCLLVFLAFMPSNNVRDLTYRKM